MCANPLLKEAKPVERPKMTVTDHKLLDGRAIAAEIRASVATDVEALKSEGWPVRLVSISVGDTEAARLYVRNQQPVSYTHLTLPTKA